MRRRRVLIVTASLLVALPLAGAVYETGARSRDARVFPPVGSFVDVGGHRLHLVCLGTGTPVVLFESSGFGNALSSRIARAELAKHTRVCSYDRMGSGRSDPAPAAVSVGMLASDLLRLQERANLPPPLVVVTASIGGLVTELFARQHPDRVAGLVFLDAATSDLVTDAQSTVDTVAVRAACSAARAAGPIGVLRIVDPFNLRQAAADDSAAALMYGARPWNALCSMVRGVERTMQEFASAQPLVADIPLSVLSAESTNGLAPPIVQRFVQRWIGPLMTTRIERHQRLASRSTRGVWRMVSGSDHLIASSRPQAVVDAVLELIGR